MGKRKVFSGEVLSDRMQKTVVVRVEQTRKHPKYSRIVRTSVSFKAHDENSQAKKGDIVRIEETRPLSKDKHFRVVEILKKQQAAEVQIKEPEV